MSASSTPPPLQVDMWRRHASVLAGLALMVCVGSNHAISVWNAQLRMLLDYSEADISFVCAMASFGAYFSVSPGFVFDRIGAHRSVLLGGGLLSGVYLSLYAGLLAFPAHMAPVGVGIAFVVVGQASNFGVFAALGPNEELYGPQHRGKVMALQLAAFSAGGAIFAVVYHSFFPGDVPGYFRFLGSLMLAVFLLAWVALYRPHEPNAFKPQPIHALDEFLPVSTHADNANNETDALLSANTSLQTSKHVEIPEEDITGRELLADERFWMLFATVFILVGSSLFVMANIAFIVESLGGPVEQIPTLVALFSVGNCGGRVVSGVVSDSLLGLVPRIYFITLASVLVAFVHTLFLIIPRELLALPITLAGVADGIMFAAFPVLTRENFGARHFGKNFGLMSVANALGFPLFYSPVGSFVYRHGSSSQSEGENEGKCIGDQCFRPIFFLVISLSVVSLLATLKFAARQRRNRSI